MLDRVFLAVIAIATSAIALKLWMQPPPVSYAELLQLSEMEDKPGADKEAIERMRSEPLQRTPWVWVRNPR